MGDPEQLPQQRWFIPLALEPAPGLHSQSIPAFSVPGSTWLCPSHGIPGSVGIKGI